LVCSGCVGTTDIADSTVTGAKIGSSQVKNSDIAGNAVTTGKIADGQVTTPDIAPGAVTAAKIGKGQIGCSEIGDNAIISQFIVNGQVLTEDIAPGAIKPNVHRVVGDGVTIPPLDFRVDTAECPSGEVLTGRGFSISSNIKVIQNDQGANQKTWFVGGNNEDTTNSGSMQASICNMYRTKPVIN
jgi:hypothetical protein